jgi:hypothetical protein
VRPSSGTEDASVGRAGQVTGEAWVGARERGLSVADEGSATCASSRHITSQG